MFGEHLKRIVTDRNAPALWSGRAGTFFGDQMHEIALIWLVWELTQSSTLTGLTAFVGRVPYWTLGWWAGIYVDRVSRRLSILLATLVGAAATAAILLAYATGVLSVGILMAAAFVVALARTVEHLAFSAQLPELVSGQNYQALLAVMDNTKRIARLVGPLIVGALEGVLAVAEIYVLVLAAYALTALAASRFQCTRALHADQQQSYMRDLKEALDTMRERRVLLLVNQCFALYAVTYAAGLWVLVPRLAGSGLDGGVGDYSLLVAAFGAGGLLGNLAFGHREFRDRGGAVLAGIALVGAGFACMAAAPNIWVAFAMAAFGATGLPLMDMSMVALIHQVTPPRQHARVMAIHRYFAEAGLGLGLLLGGPMADWLGARTTLAVLGLWVAPVVIYFWWRTRGLRLKLVATTAG